MRPINLPSGGINIGLSLPRPGGPGPHEQPPCEPGGGNCTPDIEGLFWDDDNDGLQFLPVEAGESSTNDEGFTDISIDIIDGQAQIADWVGMRVAWLRGVTCGCQTVWDVTFEDGDLAGEEQPRIHIVGNLLMVLYRQDSSGYGDGVLTATATCGDETFGPITLTQIHSFS